MLDYFFCSKMEPIYSLNITLAALMCNYYYFLHFCLATHYMFCHGCVVSGVCRRKKKIKLGFLFLVFSAITGNMKCSIISMPFAKFLIVLLVNNCQKHTWILQSAMTLWHNKKHSCRSVPSYIRKLPAVLLYLQGRENYQSVSIS